MVGGGVVLLGASGAAVMLVTIRAAPTGGSFWLGIAGLLCGAGVTIESTPQSGRAHLQRVVRQKQSKRHPFK
jgi:anthranilate/para-aminobenzoate synthase component I